MDTVIITKEQAIAQGSTPGFLRTVANSIERLGRAWLAASVAGIRDEQKYDCKSRAAVNFTNARSLRLLAKEIEKENKH